jgi:glycosidase
MAEPFETPTWVHHAVFYQIFPDRFTQSKKVVKPANLEPWLSEPTSLGYKGGDLLGVYERLDYLQDLGINAIYLNPIFQSASNHRYHTHDYMKVDPMLGGDSAFKKLLKGAHQRHIRVVLDGVFNHCSRGFFQFNDILENGPQSAYVDWFDVRGYPLHAYEGQPNYRCWWNLPALPEFNMDNRQVRDYIFSVAKYWVDQGIDGWRLDVPFEIEEDGFWQEFRQVVKKANPDAYITGEIPMLASKWLAGDQFDGVMNYMLSYGIWLYFGGKNADQPMLGHWLTHAPGMQILDLPKFVTHIENMLTCYPRPAVLAQMNLLDSHDTARFLTVVNNRKDLFLLAVLFYMTYPGAPSIYYGDEIGLTGGLDPDSRRAFPWDVNLWDTAILGFYQKCISIRHAHPALRTGDFTTLYAQDDVMVYLRRLDQDQVLIAFNCSESTRHIDLELGQYFLKGSLLKHELASGVVAIQDNRVEGLTLAPFSGVILSKV